jgi:hypothetical protein
MNASAQATNIAMVSKIAAIANLFKLAFPDTAPDLSPWLIDDQTKKFEDAHSVDLAFHFPGYSCSCRCHTILLQIKLHCEIPGQTLDRAYYARGIEAYGYGYQEQNWYICKDKENWELRGINLPITERYNQLISVFEQFLDIFNPPRI